MQIALQTSEIHELAIRRKAIMLRFVFGRDKLKTLRETFTKKKITAVQRVQERTTVCKPASLTSMNTPYLDVRQMVE